MDLVHKSASSHGVHTLSDLYELRNFQVWHTRTKQMNFKINPKYILYLCFSHINFTKKKKASLVLYFHLISSLCLIWIWY